MCCPQKHSLRDEIKIFIKRLGMYDKNVTRRLLKWCCNLFRKKAIVWIKDFWCNSNIFLKLQIQWTFDIMVTY